MRSILLVLVLIFGGQEYGYCQHYIITTSRENAIYFGIPNYIQVAVEGYLCKNLKLSTTNGELKLTEDACSYEINSSQIGKAVISIFDKKSKGKLIGKATFNVKDLPDPTALLAGKNDGEIHKGILQAQLGLTTVLNGFDFDIKFMIEAYTITILRGNTVVFTKNCISARFPNEVKDVFQKVNANDKLIFTGMSYRAPSQRIGKLQPIEFTVIE